MKQKVWSIVLALALCLGVLTVTASAADIPAYSGGTGTEADPYLIATKEDLFALAEAINADDNGELDGADTCGLGGYHGYYFKQTANIDLSGVAWAPFNFCGVYDGNGFAIKNLTVTEQRFDSTDAATGEVTSNEYEAAFFGQLVHAEIKNLTFSDCSASIAATLDPDANRDIYVGIVASTAIASRFENVKVVNCAVTQNAEEGNFGYAGGMVGYADICNFTGCSVIGGSITIGQNAKGGESAGGIVGGVGDMYDEYKDYYNMTVGAGEPFGIFNCSVTADISVNEGASGNAGGIVGWTLVDYITHTIENCYVEANITAGRATGICGYSSTKDSVNSCFANVGTFVGNIKHTIGSDGTFTNCAFCADDMTGVTGMETTSYTETQFANGTVLGVLGTAWTQNIGTDAYPILGGSNSATYAVLVDTAANGTVIADKTEAAAGVTVTLTITLDANCELVSLTVDDKDVTAGVSKGEYTFQMPAYNVTITPVFRALHQHSWSYELATTNSANDTIKATCTAANCPNTDGGSVTIAKPEQETYGDGKAANATTSGSLEGVATLPDIQYQKKSGKEWGTETTTPPTDAGTYKASITVDTDKTASVEYTVAKAEITNSTITMAGYTYNGEVSAPSSPTSNPGNGAVTYYYNTTDSNSGGTEWTGITGTTLNAGTYYLYAVIAATDNYEGYITAAVSFAVSNGSQDKPAAPTGSYAVRGTGGTKFVYTINAVDNAQYKMDEGAWQDSNMFDNIAPLSEHTFYVKLKAKTNYNESESSDGTQVTFNKLANSTVPTLNYTVSGAANSRTLTIAEVAGAEYSFDDGTTWQVSNEKTGIDGTNDATKKVRITIRYKETEVYQPSSAAQTVEVDVTKAAQTVNFDTSPRTATCGDGALEARTATAAGTITYSSSDETIATVDANGVVTVHNKAGEVTITAAAAETAEYAAASASYKLTVYAKVTLDGEPGGGYKMVIENIPAGQSANAKLGFANDQDAGIILGTDMAPDGYTFVGWYLTTDGTGEKYNFNTPVTENVTLYAKWTPNTCTVKFDPNGGSGTMADQTFTYDEAAKALTANAFTRGGYTFAGWATAADGDVVYTDGQSVRNLSKDKDAVVTLYAKWDEIYYEPVYKITVEGGGNGTIKVNRTYVTYGTTVTVTVIPEEGYELDALTVTDSAGKTIEVTHKGDGRYTFRMPSRKVTVAAAFRPVHTCPSAGYTDVDQSLWYHEAIDYVLERGLVDGVTATAFDPNGTATRALLVAALWRNEGCPVADHVLPYNDVASGQWYTEAIRWATAVGIVNGFPDGGFHPDEAITREQLATLFYRYERYKGEGFIGEWVYELPYADAGLVGDWAYEAVCWNTLHGIVQGDGTNFDPRGTATRAHVAQLLMNYLEWDK